MIVSCDSTETWSLKAWARATSGQVGRPYSSTSPATYGATVSSVTRNGMSAEPVFFRITLARMAYEESVVSKLASTVGSARLWKIRPLKNFQ